MHLSSPGFNAEVRRTGRRRFLMLSLVPLLPGFPAARAQQPAEPQKQQDEFKIGVEVNMVTVPVTVRNAAGGFLKGLPQEAFQIFEDGVEQEIISFAQEGVPTRIAILLDISGSVQTEWGTIKYATRRFAEHLKPEDQFALVVFNTEVRLKMDWGRKTDRLDAVLTSIYCKDNTNLWDALYVTSNDVLEGIREKKAIIMMSDGLDNNSSIAFNEALDAAVRSEASVYVVSKTQAVRESLLYRLAQAGYYDRLPHEAFAQADQALRKIAFETGGRVLYPNSFGQLDNIYSQVDEELRSQYTIGYVSKNQAKDGSYRRIQVGVASPEAAVSARPGYYGPSARPSPKR